MQSARGGGRAASDDAASRVLYSRCSTLLYMQAARAIPATEVLGGGEGNETRVSVVCRVELAKQTSPRQPSWGEREGYLYLVLYNTRQGVPTLPIRP